MSSPLSDDYYEVLGVGRGATPNEVKKAYRRAAVRWHPDKCRERDAEENFKRVAEAYEVLSSAERRAAYDRFGKEGARAAPRAQPHFRASASAAPHAAYNAGGGRFGGGAFAAMASMSGSNFFGFRHPTDVFKEAFAGEDPFADFESHFDDVHEEVYREPPSHYGAPPVQQRHSAPAAMFRGHHPFVGPFCGGAGGGGMLSQMMGGGGLMSSMMMGGGMGGGMMGGSMMGGGMGGGGMMMGGPSFSSSSSSSFSSSSSMGGGPGGFTSQQTVTRIVNGRRVSKTIRTGADGRAVASIEESEGGQTRRRTGTTTLDPRTLHAAHFSGGRAAGRRLPAQQQQQQQQQRGGGYAGELSRR